MIQKDRYSDIYYLNVGLNSAKDAVFRAMQRCLQEDEYIFGGAVRDLIAEEEFNDIDLRVRSVPDFLDTLNKDGITWAHVDQVLPKGYNYFSTKIKIGNVIIDLVKLECDIESTIDCDVNSLAVGKNGIVFNYVTGLNDISVELQHIREKKFQSFEHIREKKFQSRYYRRARLLKMKEKGYTRIPWPKDEAKESVPHMNGPTQDGPAVVTSNDDNAWYKNGQSHNFDDGPARMNPSIAENPILSLEVQKLLCIEPKEKKEIAPKSGKKEKMSFVEMVKNDGSKAAYRVVSKQMVNAARNALLLVAQKQENVSDQHLKLAKDFLNSEAGTAMINLILGMALTYMPKVNQDPRAQILAEDFRVEGLAVAGNAIFGVAMEMFMPIIQGAIANLPALTKEEEAKLRVGETANCQDSSLEEEVAAVAAKKTA